MARNVFSVDLEEASRKSLEALMSRTGMTKKDLVGRMLSWFGQQDEVVQHVILGTLPESAGPDIARLTLERLAGAKDQGGKKRS